MSEKSTGLEALIAAFSTRTPPRTGSLIVTIFGDVGLQRGGVLPLSDVQALLGAIGVEAGIVRTALSRLVSAGTLSRSRDGKTALYALSPAARRDFEGAADLIYGRRLPAPTGNMHLVVLDEVADRKQQRAKLIAQGFAPLTASAMIAPQHARKPPDVPEGALLLEAALSPALANRAAHLWPLQMLAEGYARVARDATNLASEAAFPVHFDVLLARILLVHEFRRIVLKDPFLPQALLPANWPGIEARRAFDGAYQVLSTRIQ